MSIEGDQPPNARSTERDRRPRSTNGHTGGGRPPSSAVARWGRRTLALVGATLLLVGLAESVAASNVAAGLTPGSSPAVVPTWLYLLTGGAAIGASGLLAGLVTDRAFIDEIHTWSRALPTAETLLRAGARAGAAVGVLALVLVVAVGWFVDTALPVANAAVVLTFVGVRATLVMVAFSIGNVWPAINPWATIARALPGGFHEYPERLGAWPAVAGLLALVWLEIVLPVTADPPTLALVALGYSVYAVAGAVVFSPRTWFHYGDPLSVIFRLFGAVAPLQRTDDGVELVLPGSRLRGGGVVTHPSEIAFVILLVWELTFNGFVVTPPGAATIEAVVAVGVPPWLAYLLLLLVGFAFFLAAYRFATRYARRTATTYVSVDELARLFAPPLLGIAAGYHLAHYAGFLVSLSPAAIAVLANPFSPPANPVVLGLPGWFGLLDVAFVLLGHLLAIWAAHGTAFAIFPGRIQAVRSQYPFVAIMVFYTMASLWLVSLPVQPPPFVDG